MGIWGKIGDHASISGKFRIFSRIFVVFRLRKEGTHMGVGEDDSLTIRDGNGTLRVGSMT